LGEPERAAADSNQCRHALLAAARRFRGKLEADQILPANMRLALFSGVPKIGNGDVWGGTGDVAANVDMARRFKVRNPGCEVTFIVVDHSIPEFQRRAGKFPLLESSTALVARMLPSLDPARTDTCQNVDGVNFYFPSMPLLQRDGFGGLERSPSTLSLPSADIALTFNDNRSRSAAILELAAPLRFIIDEPGRGHEPLRRSDSRDQVAHEHRLNSGVNHLGYYVNPVSADRLGSRLSRLEVLAAVTTQTGHQLDVDMAHAFVYCGREWLDFDYFSLLDRAAARLGKPIDVFVAGRANAPQSLSYARIINLGHIDHALFEQLVWLSDFPPIVTGDVSLSQALETSVRGRGFIYSRPSWKSAGMADLYQFILDRYAPRAGDKSSRNDFAAKLRACLWAGGDDVAAGGGGVDLIEAICDEKFQSSFAATLAGSLCEISMCKNLELFIIWILLAQEIFGSATPPQALEDTVFRAIRQSSSLPDFIQKMEDLLKSMA
jgi:hypothetical protein